MFKAALCKNLIKPETSLDASEASGSLIATTPSSNEDKKDDSNVDPLGRQLVPTTASTSAAGVVDNGHDNASKSSSDSSMEKFTEIKVELKIHTLQQQQQPQAQTQQDQQMQQLQQQFQQQQIHAGTGVGSGGVGGVGPGGVGENKLPLTRYSRKVFVGGLPPDIEETGIIASFCPFGPLFVDWPHKTEYSSKYPPKGYAFLIFKDEASVRSLVDACLVEDDKMYLYVSSISICNKPVQIRPWRICDAECDMSKQCERDQRKTVFVGGVPRPMKALELAMIMERLYGNVCYAAIDTDTDMRYPKGAGRVTFSSQDSYVKALSDRFVQLKHGDIDKRVEIKPYVLDNQQCDVCCAKRRYGIMAPFFCTNIGCLRYYCTSCWADAHTGPNREFHRPLVKEGNDRPRPATFRW